MAEYLFVYGTLRQALGHPLHGLLRRHAEYAGQARFAGRLFDVGGYPAAVADPGAAPGVLGELYRLHSPEALWGPLDRYEGCTDGGDPHDEYRREQRRVIRADGSQATAWIYLYNRPTHRLRAIPGGDYLAHAGGSAGREP
jgi:gamma-glutamylcyclotransferase (GGCT)/AIG2-like uncharacterized protein YtfP